MTGYRRNKVTLACDTCRKRRVKCSGTSPCTLCAEVQRPCNFDEKNRGRRGPRPKSDQQVPRVQHELAPAPPRWGSDTVPPKPGPVAVIQPEPAASETIVVAEPGDNSEDDDVYFEAEEIPHVSTWRPALESLLYDQAANTPAPDPGYIDLLCHLVELYWECASWHMRLVLPPAGFVERIILAKCPQSLVLAVCASCVRFSIHRATQDGLPCPIDEQLEDRARRLLDTSGISGDVISRLQTICILVDYATAKGNGQCAWVDIAIGRSLVELTRASVNLDSGTYQTLEHVDHYLATAATLCSVGHPSLQPPSQTLGKSMKMPNNDPISLEKQLFRSFIRIRELCAIPFSEQSPPPWQIGSEFSILQNDLDRILLRQTSPHATHTSILWNACVILLNRNFLPIVERIRSSEAQTTVKLIDFPGAPPLFLNERVRRCGSSAAAICKTCRDIVVEGEFFQHATLAGFCCVQSALVLINQLHQSGKSPDKRVVDNLKFMFVFIGAVRRFYRPARQWINALFQVHDINAPLRHASNPIETAFTSYFDRFENITEPSFTTLCPTPSGDVQESSESWINSADRGLIMGKPPTVTNGPPESTSWLQNYTGHLLEDICSTDENDAPNQTDTRIRDNTASLSGEFRNAPSMPAHPPIQSQSSLEQTGAVMSTNDFGPLTTPHDGGLGNPALSAAQATLLPDILAQFGDLSTIMPDFSSIVESPSWDAGMWAGMFGNDNGRSI
ncbi:hypothetical protein F5B20DRAFT_416273 [Whalleya microplaca]|nr:hypothetical protein F5B20DRAFT_416273 [Whalleya microplaca]